MLVPEQQEKNKAPTPLNVVVFGSGTGTNLQALIRDQNKWKDPPYRIRAVFSERSCKFLEIAEQANITPLYLSFTDFFEQQNCLDLRDQSCRCLYDENIIQLLDQLPYSIDMVILAGYMKLLHAPILSRYKDKIINVHPADLTVTESNGKRRYSGANSVYKALAYGENRTRSTVHLVNEHADEGTILVSGPWVNYTGPYPVTQESAEAHQEKQKRASDWPALVEAVELISQGRLTVKEENQVYLDGIAMPRGGVIM